MGRWCGAFAAAVVAVGTAVAATACATSPPPDPPGRGVTVVAAENVWGSLAAQLGGERATVASIIDSPAADPHDYEPTAADGRAVAGARLVIVNGAGYDPWAGNLVEANADSGRTVLTVGELVGVGAGGNPHRWYNPTDVRAVIDRITAAYKAIDPAGAAFYDARHDLVLTTNLRPYFDRIDEIRARYAGTRVGASESIFAMMAPALGLDLVTPAGFLTAISEGTDPSAADKATIDAQIATRAIKVYVFNSQNATPDVQSQVDAARAHGIPVATITETLTPAGATFQDWQVAQLTALAAALAQGTGGG
jgi:zinc/manganese transport system substrate-binding protein